MTGESRENLIAEAMKQLWTMPYVSWLTKGKRFVRKYLLHQLVEPVDYIFWPKGCLLLGLVQTGMNGEVAEYFDWWIKKGAKLYTVDDFLAGQALLLLINACEQNRGQNKESAPYMARQLYQYEMKAHTMMSFLYGHVKDEQGSIPYRPLHKTNHIYADGIGMICPFAVGYGVKYHDKEAVKLAMKQFRNFVEYGMDKQTNLPYHAYRYHADAIPEQLGAVGWGRAAGWILYGLGMSLQFLDQETVFFSEEREELLQMTEKLSEKVLQYRNAEGMFGSFLCDPASPTDTSATAMILHGIRMLRGGEYRTAYEQGKINLQKYCVGGKVFQAQSECIGLGEYGEEYDSFPWSVGMTLSLLVLS